MISQVILCGISDSLWVNFYLNTYCVIFMTTMLVKSDTLWGDGDNLWGYAF